MSLRFARTDPDRHPANIRHFGRDRTTGERVADLVAARVGSWPFIIIQSSLLALWIVANAWLIGGWIAGKPFDPYPFILLNLMLSFQAAYTGPIVMMSQNRQAAKDRDQAEHDFAVNREALDRLKSLQESHDRLLSEVERLRAGGPRPGG